MKIFCPISLWHLNLLSAGQCWRTFSLPSEFVAIEYPAKSNLLFHRRGFPDLHNQPTLFGTSPDENLKADGIRLCVDAKLKASGQSEANMSQDLEFDCGQHKHRLAKQLFYLLSRFHKCTKRILRGRARRGKTYIVLHHQLIWHFQHSIRVDADRRGYTRGVALSRTWHASHRNFILCGSIVSWKTVREPFHFLLWSRHVAGV